MSWIKVTFFSNRLRTLLTLTGIFVILYGIAGFFIIPRIAQPKIIELVSDLSGREAHIEKLKLNPFTLSATMEGFELTDLDGEALLSLSRGHANLQLPALVIFREFHFKRVALQDPYFRFQVNADGSLNIADLLNEITGTGTVSSDEETAKEPRHLRVDLLKVQQGSVSITDLSRGSHFATQISPINFDINGFHTSGKSDAPYAFSAVSESGETLNWEGYVALAPFRSKGAFKLQGIALPKYAPFSEIVLETQTLTGVMGLSGSYEFVSGDAPVARLEEGALTLENLEVVKGSDQSPVLSLAAASISGVEMDQHARSLEIQEIEIQGGQLQAIRQPDGHLDLPGLIKLASSERNPVAEAPSAVSGSSGAIPGDFSFHIHKLQVQECAVTLIDQSLQEPAALGFNEIGFDLANFSNRENTPMNIGLRLRAKTGGSIALGGSATLVPIHADLALEVSKLALSVIDPYIAEYAGVRLSEGTFSMGGSAGISLHDNKPSASFSGALWYDDVSISSNDSGEEILGLTSLDLGGLDASLNPTSIHIHSINITNPKASVSIDENGASNLSRAFMPPPSETGEVSEKDVPVETTNGKGNGIVFPFPVSIGSITLENAAAKLHDQSVKPAVDIGLEKLSGTISGLSSEELARADLQLEGKLTGGQQLAITGKINPLIADRYSDVEISFNDFDLRSVSPYSGKYAGYALQQGDLSFDLKYKVSHAELSGENVVIIDQLTLGDRVESEEALNLPIPLAVSLLKDPNGVIEIDIPVSGNLNDPEFSFGRVIGRAFVNVLTKLITSPFSMLGNLVPGGGEVDLSMIDFAVADSGISDEARAKLDLLATALKERPALRLEILGNSGGPDEIVELKKRELEEGLRLSRWEKLGKRRKASTPYEEFLLRPEDRERELMQAYTTAFPEEPNASAPRDVSASTGPDSSSIEEAPVRKEPGLIAKFFQALFGVSSEKTADKVEEPLPEPIKAAPTQQPTLLEMEAQLLQAIEIDPVLLLRLADQRAEAVRLYLEIDCGIAPGRLGVSRAEEEDSGNAEARFQLQ